MTAFLFIPATRDARYTRRVDFANIASLFTETDEPAPTRRSHDTAARVAAMLLILFGAIGDTILVARPDALARCFTGSHQTISGAPSRPASF